jgi:hypothetical protein
MLEDWISSFKRRKDRFLRIHYTEKNVSSYHFYQGGEKWIPTVSRTIAKPGERLRIEPELLTPRVFFANFPTVRLGIRRKRAWTTEHTEVRVVEEPGKVRLQIHQDPPVEGVSRYVIEGQRVEDLRFQKTSVFATIGIPDVFSRLFLVQLHHHGHGKAWLSRRSRASARIRLLSFDGVRLRVLYQLNRAMCSTVVYMEKPSVLFRLGKIIDFPRNIETPGLEKRFLINQVNPVREMEAAMIQHGRHYEAGRVGAEISYTIVREALGKENLILNEPARGGTDLFTQDRRVLVESRFLVEKPVLGLSQQIAIDLAKITRKIRNDFRWNPSAEVGYVVLSYLDNGQVSSLVAEMPNPR